jgi:16S rRNA (guanine1207-N2)-methyltransferase
MNTRERLITAAIDGREFTFRTIPGLFSPRYIDKSTLAMLSVIEFGDDEKILDLGCGYGVIGIWAATRLGPERVVMVDIDPNAVTIAAENAKLNGVEDIRLIQSDGFRNLDEAGFTTIISNPPYHTDFAVAKHFVHKGFNRLKVGGQMYLSAKRELWYKNKLNGIFGNVRIWHLEGYSIFRSIKRTSTYAKVAKRR